MIQRMIRSITDVTDGPALSQGLLVDSPEKPEDPHAHTHAGTHTTLTPAALPSPPPPARATSCRNSHFFQHAVSPGVDASGKGCGRDAASRGSPQLSVSCGAQGSAKRVTGTEEEAVEEEEEEEEEEQQQQQQQQQEIKVIPPAVLQLVLHDSLLTSEEEGKEEEGGGVRVNAASRWLWFQVSRYTGRVHVLLEQTPAGMRMGSAANSPDTVVGREVEKASDSLNFSNSGGIRVQNLVTNSQKSSFVIYFVTLYSSHLCSDFIYLIYWGTDFPECFFLFLRA